MSNQVPSEGSRQTKPRVSLALPVFNGEKFVAEAIKSILAQDYEDFELLIIDNASTDGTERICRDFAAADARIKYLRNQQNVGAAPNFNLGFKVSSAPYFKWCAHDDLISRNFIGACVRALDAEPEAVLAYGITESIDSEGSVIPLIGSMMPEMTATIPARRFFNVVASWSACYEIFGLIRRDALMQTTLHKMYYGSDRALLAELALLGTFVRVPDIVFYNRDHESRSLMIADKKLKKEWHGATPETKHALEHLPLLQHLIEIAIRQRRISPAYRSLPLILIWALKPLQVARYLLELIGIASPSAQIWLRQAGWRVLDMLRRPTSLARQ